jgi:hypothetical protein
MSQLVTSVICVGIFCVFLVATRYVEIRKKKERADQGIYPSSFANRHEQMLAEIEARKSAEQIYRARIDAAFNEARECGALLVSDVPYYDIEIDMCRANRSDTKTLLTRITPLLTQELAEMVREYEIKNDGLKPSASCCICVAARAITWRVEEVPAQYEPPNMKDTDRISYPDLSSIYTIPESVRKAARKLLDYGDDYVLAQAELRAQSVSSFEVTEE